MDLIQAYRAPESTMVDYLLALAELPTDLIADIEQRAKTLVQQVRNTRLKQGGLDAFLLQYDLSSEEGIALMCLAEALLRIPDAETIDKLIQDKICSADWSLHTGKSHSLFVNAATWALMLTGRIIEGPQQAEETLSRALGRFVARTSEPIIRRSVIQAMRLLGHQFVMGRTILEALRRAKKLEKQGYRYSYDMLGESALTDQDANRYFEAYQLAIEAIAAASAGRGPVEGPGISVKLSALHARYEWAQEHRVKGELLPRLKELACLAKKANIGLTIDAEESERLILSLDLLEALLADPQLAEWEGLGLAVQAYQKRAPYVLDWLVEKARFYERRLMVRLVKGAYWDTEIKHTQVEGLSDYAVYTQKIATDVSYIACIKKMFAASDVIFPQFATHNAYTVSVVMALAQGKPFEFQCLHGMGEALYDPLVGFGAEQYRCRIYAPVGTHEDLLAYLVRRLLENGANSSFVNRIIDEDLPIETLIQNPVAVLASLPEKRHPAIPLPSHIYGAGRLNAQGLDLNNPADYAPVLEKIALLWEKENPALPLSSTIAICDPSLKTRCVGQVQPAGVAEALSAMSVAQEAFEAWDTLGIEARADLLSALAHHLEAEREQVLALLIREAGKTMPDAVAELREAVDFCRYYATQARALGLQPLTGPTGESNTLSYRGRGVWVCISPWNFPLAIFMGQIVAALVMGNTVVAKPAEQTPLIAVWVVEAMHALGFPKQAIQLLPGAGEVLGPALLEHPALAGVLFTGSTTTAKIIHKTLAHRLGAIIPLIAETGGQNAMIVDSSALPEQVVKDVIRSAFYSAGQRCSALRVLYLQEEVAPKVIAMLQGAMKELVVGDPGLLSTDIGPVIDADALGTLLAHIARLKAMPEATLLAQVPVPPEHEAAGTFCPPTAFEIPNLQCLTEEVFGPILHIIRFKNDALAQVVSEINNTGYGLTCGVHSRISKTIAYVADHIKAGNLYVNRNMTGAVVGVQPFGGEGLSGTGPKAGGPNYLIRLATERVLTINTAAAGGNASLMALPQQQGRQNELVS